MSPALLADILLCLHFAWVAFIVASVPLIALGGARGWRWVRNRTYRRVHLLMMGIVAAEAVFGIFCPLTVWENELRARAGETGRGESFVAHYVSRWLYYDLPPWFFLLIYLVFLILIVVLYRRVTPR